jgi:hypothetical protein
MILQGTSPSEFFISLYYVNVYLVVWSQLELRSHDGRDKATIVCKSPKYDMSSAQGSGREPKICSHLEGTTQTPNQCGGRWARFHNQSFTVNELGCINLKTLICIRSTPDAGNNYLTGMFSRPVSCSTMFCS